MGIAQTKFGKQAPLEAGGEAHIPVTCHVDENTLKTRDGKLIQIIKLAGVAHSTSDSSQLDDWKTTRNYLWRSLSDSKLSVWTHIVRYKKGDYPGGDFEGGFAAELNGLYREKVGETDLYVNDIYICLVRKGRSEGVQKFLSVIKKAVQKDDKAEIRAEQKQEIESLNEARNKVLKGLSVYEPKTLGVYFRDTEGRRVETTRNRSKVGLKGNVSTVLPEELEKDIEKGNVYRCSEALEFLGFIVNGDRRTAPLGYCDISKNVLRKKISFEKSYYVTEGEGDERECGGIVSIKEYTGKTSAGITDSLLTLPVEFVLTQSFTFIAKPTALNLFKTQIRRLKNSGDSSETQLEELEFALDQLTANKFCMGDHHFSLNIKAKSLKELNNNVALCVSELADVGLIMAREYLGIEGAFWAQIPGNHSYIARRSPITSTNFSGFASFHNYPSGKIDGNHWGNAVALLKTISGTPYYFNFHFPKDLGNATVIGPSGAGKTVLMLFLAAQMEKFRPRQVFFDKDRGAEIFIRAAGGVYSPIAVGKASGFNPLQLPDTEQNRKFLRDFLAQLVAEKGQELKASELEEIAMAVKGNYKLPREQRRLRNVWDFFKFGEKDGLKDRLKPWLEGEERGWLFDNQKDRLSLDSRLLGFDVTEFLGDKTLRTPILMYLFHRIDSLLNGEPISISLDEGWNLLDDEVFRRMFRDWLKVIRKKEGITIFGTQEPEDVMKSAVGGTILSQSPTQLFLPNSKAKEKDYIEGFGLTRREFEIIKSLEPSSRCFLIKQGHSSVVANLDLSGLDDQISVLSGTTANVKLLEDIRKRVGEEPQDWLPVFYEERG